MPDRAPLIVLLTAQDVADAVSADPDSLAGQVVAFDINAHRALNTRGIAHHTPWDIIAYDELAALREFQHTILDHWETAASLPCAGLDLLKVARFRHVAAFSRLAWAAYAADRFVQELRPRRVVVFREPPGHGLDQPPEFRQMPLLSGMLRAAAEQRDIPVTTLPRKQSAWRDQAATHAHTHKPPIDLAEQLAGRPYVLFQANASDLLRQLPLIAALRAESDHDVAQVYRAASDDVVAQCLAAGHHVWHDAQILRPASSPLDPVTAADARSRFDAAARGLPDRLRLIFDNAHIQPHFDFLFGPYAERVATQGRQWQTLFDEHPPAAVVANYHSPLLDVAATRDVPCLVLTHALMMIGYPRWFTSLPGQATIGAMSTFHRQRLIENGLPPQRILISGDPWVRRVRTAAAAVTPDSCTELRRRLGLVNRRPMVLLCTGNNGMPDKAAGLPPADWAEGVRNLHALGQLASRRGDLHFVIKRHPRYDDPELLAEINAALPPDRLLIDATAEPLERLARAADVVCMWNTLSSVVVEASLLDRPVVIFSRCLAWTDPAEWALDGWPCLDSLEAFEHEVDHILKDAAHRQRRIEQARRATTRFVGDDPDNVLAACVEWLSNARLATNPPCQRVPQPPPPPRTQRPAPVPDVTPTYQPASRRP